MPRPRAHVICHVFICNMDICNVHICNVDICNFFICNSHVCNYNSPTTNQLKQMKQYINEVIDQLTEKHEPLRVFSLGYLVFILTSAALIYGVLWCYFNI